MNSKHFPMSLLQASAMEHGRTVLTEAVRKVQLLEIDGYCATAAMECSEYIKFKWIVDGHEWEVRFYPDHCEPLDDEDVRSIFDDCVEWVALKLILFSEPQRDKLRVNLSCRLVSPSQHLNPSKEKSVSHVFDRRSKCSPEVLLMLKHEVPSSGYLVNDSLTVECTITVLGADDEEQPLPVPPPSDLHKHLGELLQSHEGADVRFHVSGESFAAHKAILAARSPVFKAEFFGDMDETSSESVVIEDMEAVVFKSMLHFIYTDMAPELDGDQEPQAAATMVQHLLVAADR